VLQKWAPVDIDKSNVGRLLGWNMRAFRYIFYTNIRTWLAKEVTKCPRTRF